MTLRPAALLALVAVLSSGVAARAAEDELPARQRVLLLLRVLAYDRNLKLRAGEAMAVAVLYRKGDARSEECQRDLLGTFEELAASAVVAGLPIQPRALAFTGAVALEAALGAPRTAALFVCPGLEDAAQALQKAARRRQTFTAAAGRALAEAGLSLGLVQRGDRAGLVINLEAARAEGADLDSALLRIAEVLRPAPAAKPDGSRPQEP